MQGPGFVSRSVVITVFLRSRTPKLGKEITVYEFDTMQSVLSLPSAGITGVCDHTQPIIINTVFS